MTKEQLKKLNNDKIDALFSDLIREKMNDKTFWKWVSSWYDAASLCDMAEEWERDVKMETLNEYIKLLK